MDLLTLELDEAQKLKVKVTDLSGRINLNRVIKRDDKGAESLNKPVFEQLVTLIDQALLEMDRAAQDGSEELSAEEIAYAIADWIDSDESRLSDGSFEDQSYNSRKDAYSSKNGPFDSVAELQLVEGIDDAVYAAIRNAVTVYPFEGTDAINVNTAPKVVLRSIRLRENQAIKTPEPLSEEHIERILEARADEIAIASQLELRGLLGLDAAAIFTPRLTFGSDVFAIESVAKTNKTIARLQTVVERGNGGARVLYWRMD
jgi:type II secretory pathway component PulK